MVSRPDVSAIGVANDRAVAEFLGSFDRSAFSVYELAVRCSEAGLADAAVARALGVKPSTVRKWRMGISSEIGLQGMNARGFELRRSPRKVDPEQQAQAVAMVRAGASIEEAKAAFDLPFHTVKRGLTYQEGYDAGFAAGREAAVAEADLASMPSPWRERYERLEARLASEFSERVRRAAFELAESLYDDASRDRMVEVRRVAKLLSVKRGYMHRSMFRKILASLSPDGRRNLSDSFLSECFIAIKSLEAVLVFTDEEVRRMFELEQFAQSFRDAVAAKQKRDAERSARKASKPSGRDVARRSK